MKYIFQYSITYKHILLLAASLLMFIAFSYAMYSIYSYFREYGIISMHVDNVYQRMCDINKKREQKNIAVLIERGNEEDKSILSFIDKIITYSGINKKFKWLNTEVAISINTAVVILIALVLSITSGDVSKGILAALLFETVIVIVIVFMSNRNYIKVEDSLLQFIGCIENFSATGNDIIVILEHVSRYVDPIIGKEISRCVMEARNSGNVTASMTRLEKSFQNSYWQLIIRNISICSRYSCNYSDVIAQLKDIIEEFIVYEKERRERYRNNRIMIAALLAIGIIAMKYISIVIGTSIIEMVTINNAMMLMSIIGLTVVVYIAIIKGMIH